MSIKFECPACGKRLNAPDSAEGKTAKCPACSMSVTVPAPEKIYEAEEVSDEPEPEDWEAPDDDDDEIPVSKSVSRRRNESVEDDLDRKPCPMCGEMINAAAKKCRYCGESLVSGAKKKKKKVSSEDTEMQGSDWALCILCGSIACILGVVYLIQGKPKGGTMIGVSIGFGILWQIVWAILSAVIDAV